MTDDQAEKLSGPEIVLLIEALDAMIPFRDDTRHIATEAERFQWRAHHVLRGKLKAAVGMSFYDKSAGWLDQELAREREAVASKLFSRLGELMREPGATRRSVKTGFGQAVREIRESRQSSARPF